MLFFSACFISFLYHLQTFFIVLNIFLHLTHIYANIFNSFFLLTLKMTEYRSKSRFLSGVIFTCTLTVFIYLFNHLFTDVVDQNAYFSNVFGTTAPTWKLFGQKLWFNFIVFLFFNIVFLFWYGNVSNRSRTWNAIKKLVFKNLTELSFIF